MTAALGILLLLLSVLLVVQHVRHDRERRAMVAELDRVLEAVPAVFDELAREHREAIRASVRAEIEAEQQQELARLQAFWIEANRRFAFGQTMREQLQSGRKERVS